MSNNLTRRALLRGSATAAIATAAIALPAATEAAQLASDPILEAWRAWRPLEEESARLLVERERIWETLPEAVTRPSTWALRRRGGRGQAPFYSVKMYDAFSEVGDPEYQEMMRNDRPNFVRRLRRAVARARREQDKSGYTGLNQRLPEIWAMQDELWVAIRESAGSSPASIAAKIDVGLSWSDPTDFLADLPHCLACSVVRDLLPQLPPDMAAALEPIAAAKGTLRDAYLRGGDAA